MKNYLRPRGAMVLVFALTLSQLPMPVSFAQGRARPSSIERRIGDMTRQREQFERDSMSKEEKPGAQSRQRVNRVTTRQVRQDFERVQAVYNDIVRALSANADLDHRIILNATAELKKRASRLQINLVLPEPPKDDKKSEEAKELGEGQMKAMLVTLCKHVVSFVTNPLFETSEVLDLELSRKASSDLMRIIELSHSINRSAGRIHQDQ